jgi:hypothetical protein
MRLCSGPAHRLSATSPHTGDPYTIARNVSAETLGASAMVLADVSHEAEPSPNVNAGSLET